MEEYTSIAPTLRSFTVDSLGGVVGKNYYIRLAAANSYGTGDYTATTATFGIRLTHHPLSAIANYSRIPPLTLHAVAPPPAPKGVVGDVLDPSTIEIRWEEMVGTRAQYSQKQNKTKNKFIKTHFLNFLCRTTPELRAIRSIGAKMTSSLRNTPFFWRALRRRCAAVP